MTNFSINLVVLNGTKYVRACLDSIVAQTYSHQNTELRILDNGSTDGTIELLNEYQERFSDFKSFAIIKSSHNHGMWGGQEELLKQSTGEFVVAMAIDVVLDPDFLTNAARVIDNNPAVGAIQAKTYQFSIETYPSLPRTLIDTCGFEIFQSRRVINIGHGQEDRGQFDQQQEIFGVEGAVPIIKKEALESIRVLGEISDHDLFWYAEDLDVAWRLQLAGWLQIYAPNIVAWHDRQTTKKLRKSLADFRDIRRQISLKKRRLEWRNIRFTIIKNDYIINILKDLPQIAARELMMTAYLAIFEPSVLGALPSFIRYLPRMLIKRKKILSNAKASPDQIHRWFH